MKISEKNLIGEDIYNKKMDKLNPKLKVGDKVILLDMEGEPGMYPGLKGRVNRIDNFGSLIQYNVEWENGSTLSLLPDSSDIWKKLDDSINEQRINDDLENVTNLIEFFDLGFFIKYLEKLKNCGIVNMFGAAHYLYMGKKRFELEIKYHNHDNEICEEVLEMADESQSKLIEGVINILEKEEKEESVERINSYARKYSHNILSAFMSL